MAVRNKINAPTEIVKSQEGILFEVIETYQEVLLVKCLHPLALPQYISIGEVAPVANSDLPEEYKNGSEN